MAGEFDYVGHITYPYNKTTESAFYNKNSNIKYKVMRNGFLLSDTTKLKRDIVNLLTMVGYRVEGTKIRTTAAKRSVGAIPITVHKVGSKGHPQELLVLVKARDLKELSSNTDRLLKMIERKTGIKGKLDVLGKLEMC
jgi:hypothetical protein